MILSSRLLNLIDQCSVYSRVSAASTSAASKKCLVAGSSLHIESQYIAMVCAEDMGLGHLGSQAEKQEREECKKEEAEQREKNRKGKLCCISWNSTVEQVFLFSNSHEFICNYWRIRGSMYPCVLDLVELFLPVPIKSCWNALASFFPAFLDLTENGDRHHNVSSVSSDIANNMYERLEKEVREREEQELGCSSDGKTTVPFLDQSTPGSDAKKRGASQLDGGDEAEESPPKLLKMISALEDEMEVEAAVSQAARDFMDLDCGDVPAEMQECAFETCDQPSGAEFYVCDRPVPLNFVFFLCAILGWPFTYTQRWRN